MSDQPTLKIPEPWAGLLKQLLPLILTALGVAGGSHYLGAPLVTEQAHWDTEQWTEQVKVNKAVLKALEDLQSRPVPRLRDLKP